MGFLLNGKFGNPTYHRCNLHVQLKRVVAIDLLPFQTGSIGFGDKEFILQGKYGILKKFEKNSQTVPT